MYLEDFYVGMVIDVPEVTIDRDRMVAFALEYDPFPVHYDDDYARTTRFGSVIAPGVMSFMAVWARFVECDVFGEQLIAGKSTRIEWSLPVFADDTLTGRVTVSAITPRNKYNGIIETTMTVTDQHGDVVLTNVTETIVARRV